MRVESVKNWVRLREYFYLIFVIIQYSSNFPRFSPFSLRAQYYLYTSPVEVQSIAIIVALLKARNVYRYIHVYTDSK